MIPTTQTRKADHIRICLEEDVQCRQQTTGFEHYRFSHACLPDLDYDELELKTTFFGKTLGLPLLISSMTGGTAQAQEINRNLAIAAQTYGLAMGVGSQRVMVEQPDLGATFGVRSHAPDILLFANLGAVQLNYSYGVEQCREVVDRLAADALILHLNPLQECIQPRGDKNFKGLLPKIAEVCHKLPVPVIVKEVGNGISAAMAQKLVNVGVAAIDVAGAGGTSWAKVESERAETPLQRQLGRTFADWGIPTADCLVSVRNVLPQLPLIASGGIRDGLDVAKALSLGADLVGLAFPFLQAAAISATAVGELVQRLEAEIATVLFCTGNRTVADLQQSQMLRRFKD